MWVLSRDPTTYFEKYGKTNKDTLTKLNFTGLLNKYVERDWTNCVINYEPWLLIVYKKLIPNI